MSFLLHPQRLWWRKAMFQVHLWTGIVLCLYMLVIGVTGSLLVFEKELERVAYKDFLRASTTATGGIDFPGAADVARRAFPDAHLTVGYVPDRAGENYEFFLTRNQHTKYVFVDSATGCVAGMVDPDHSWLVWLIQLHFYLLAGHTGLVVNGLGAISLLLLCLSGAVVWWRGIRHWARGLTLRASASWRRVNFDLHSAVGFWTLLLLSMWAVTGIYLVWSKPAEALVNHFSSIASANAPAFSITKRVGEGHADLHTMIAQAEEASPNATFVGAFFPRGSEGAMTLLMARTLPRSFVRMDYVYFDPASGRQLAMWRRGDNKTWGSRLVFWMSPLHFGYDFGLTIKILWAIAGLALPLLSITGVLMYWNRSLGKKWRRMRSLSATSDLSLRVIDSRPSERTRHAAP